MLRLLHRGLRASSSPSLRRFATQASPAAVSPTQLPALRDVLLRQPGAQITTLPNGIRVASEQTGGETATVGVWWDTGSRYETPDNTGTAHFIEHMFFKGTNKRTTQQLELEVENLGGHLNAYTSRQTTTFYAKTFKKDVRQGLDILADILQNSTIDESAVEAEKETIIREGEEVEKNMEEVIFDRLHETAFRGTQLAQTILGSEDNIRSMTREKLLDYRASQLVGPRLVIAGAGAVSHDELVKISQELFGGIPTNPSNNKPLTMEPAQFTGSSIRLRFDDMEQCHVALAWPTAGWSDHDHFTLMVIQSLLGSYSPASENEGASFSGLVQAYATGDIGNGFNTFNCQYSDMGLFGVYYQGHATRMQRASWYVLEEFRRLAYDVTPQALENAKMALITALMSSLDGSTARCEEVGRQVLTLGRRMHVMEAVERVAAVDEAAIRSCAKRYFWDHDFALAAVGPTWELPDYNWMRRRTFAARF